MLVSATSRFKGLEKRHCSIFQNLYNLFVVERFLPSDEFIEAVGALTVVQKGHIGELSIGNRRTELDQVMNGIILSLPDEVQIKVIFM